MLRGSKGRGHSPHLIDIKLLQSGSSSAEIQFLELLKGNRSVGWRKTFRSKSKNQQQTWRHLQEGRRLLSSQQQKTTAQQPNSPLLPFVTLWIR